MFRQRLGLPWHQLFVIQSFFTCSAVSHSSLQSRFQHCLPVLLPYWLLHPAEWCRMCSTAGRRAGRAGETDLIPLCTASLVCAFTSPGNSRLGHLFAQVPQCFPILGDSVLTLPLMHRPLVPQEESCSALRWST